VTVELQQLGGCVCFLRQEEGGKGSCLLAKIDAFLRFLGLLRQHRSVTRYGCPNPEDPLIKIKRFSGFPKENQDERRQ